MKLIDIIQRSGRSLRSAKARTLLTALAIAVGTFALALTLAASNGATKYVNKLISENFDPAELIVTNDESLFGRDNTAKPREYDSSYTSFTNQSGASSQIKRITDDDIATIKALSGVERIREQIAVSLQYVTRPDQKKYIGTVQAMSPYQKMDTVAGSVPQNLADDQLLLPEGYVEALGLRSPEQAIGQTITLAINKPLTADVVQQSAASLGAADPTRLARLSEQNIQTRDFMIAAVLKKPAAAQPGTELYMYISQSAARSLNDLATAGTSNYRKYNYIYVRVKNGEQADTLKRTQDLIKQKGYVAQSVKDTQEFLTNIIGVLKGIVAGFGAIAVIASVFGIVNTMYISVLQRTREIGLMKALGMRKRDIGRLFRFEAAWIGFLGGLLGSLAALAAGAALNPWITKALDLGAGNRLLIFEPMQLFMLVVILMVVSILAGWLPSRKAAKLDPIQALRTE